MNLVIERVNFGRFAMKMTKSTDNVFLYMTWYEFKKELEKRSGNCILNWDWIKIKPKHPLPWDNSHMQSAFNRLSRLEKRKCARKQTSRIVH